MLFAVATRRREDEGVVVPARVILQGLDEILGDRHLPLFRRHSVPHSGGVKCKIAAASFHFFVAANQTGDKEIVCRMTSGQRIYLAAVLHPLDGGYQVAVGVGGFDPEARSQFGGRNPVAANVNGLGWCEQECAVYAYANRVLRTVDANNLRLKPMWRRPESARENCHPDAKTFHGNRTARCFDQNTSGHTTAPAAPSGSRPV